MFGAGAIHNRYQSLPPQGTACGFSKNQTCLKPWLYWVMFSSTRPSKLQSCFWQEAKLNEYNLRYPRRLKAWEAFAWIYIMPPCKVPKHNKITWVVFFFLAKLQHNIYIYIHTQKLGLIRTPTWGLRKPLLPCKTAYARVTFQEVPTRLPWKLLQRYLYLMWCGHNSGSEEE